MTSPGELVLEARGKALTTVTGPALHVQDGGAWLLALLQGAARRAGRYRPALSAESTCAGWWRVSVRAVTTTLRRSAPVFITTDLGRASAHYERLGFTVQAYDGGDFYGFACRDGLEIHLAKVESIDHATNTCCTYLWVDDAWALHDEWAAAQVDGRLKAPVKTDYGLDEGAHVDPDGNLIRFGSPPLPPRALR